MTTNKLNPYVKDRPIYISAGGGKCITYGDIRFTTKEAAIDYLKGVDTAFCKDELICDSTPQTKKIKQLVAAGFGVLFTRLAEPHIYYFSPCKG